MKRGAKQSSDRTGPHRLCGALLIGFEEGGIVQTVCVDDNERKPNERGRGVQVAGGKEDTCYVLHGYGDGAGARLWPWSG